MGRTTSKPRYFATPAEWRAWLEKHHATAEELLVGFHKVGSGKPSITWPESVDEALCFGWIDGVRRSLGADAYTIRFTPRRKGSIWSEVNIARVAELEALGKMRPAGRDAFAARIEARSAIYAYEQRQTAELPPEYAKRLTANPKARAFFDAQPPWYRRVVSWWVISAKREETRDKRFATLLSDCAAERRVRGLIPPAKSRGDR